MNSFGNHVLAANVTFNGGTMNIGSDSTDNAINIGIAANAGRIITIGSYTGTSSTALFGGSSGVSLGTTGGPISILAGTGLISVGSDSSTGAISIGAPASSRVITIGNISGTTSVNTNAGSGGVNITTTNSTFQVNTGTGAINIGTDAVAKTTTIGTTTTTSTLAEKCGTGGYTLASASGTLINAASTGPITMPHQSAFLAYNNAAQSNLTGNVVLVSPVRFNATVYDLHSDFNTGSYTFTAPVTGYYFFNVHIFYQNLGALNTIIYAELDTNARNYPLIDGSAGLRDGNNNYASCASTMADMTAGDTATVITVVYGGTQVVGIGGGAAGVLATWFSGVLIC